MNPKISIITILFCPIFTASNITKASKKKDTNVFCRNANGIKEINEELKSIEWLQNKINTTEKLRSFLAKTTIVTPWIYPLYTRIKTKKIPSWKSLFVSGAITAAGWWYLNKNISDGTKLTLTNRINDLDEMIGNNKSWNGKIIDPILPNYDQLLQNFKPDNSIWEKKINELESYKKTVKVAQSNLAPLKSIATKLKIIVNKLKKINNLKTKRIHEKLCHFININSSTLSSEKALLNELIETKQ